jgi:hypothetical protein
MSAKDAKTERKYRLRFTTRSRAVWRLAFRTRRRPSDFAPSSETPGGYVGQAVLESGCQRERLAKLREGVFPGSRPAAAHARQDKESSHRAASL